MPGCAAVGCNNRSEKGYRMKCFPRDPKLRKIWQERVGRADWEPSNNSFLCHEHFESDKWCIMENGRVKLKKDAIPSIFTITSTRKSIKKRLKITNDNGESNCEIKYSMMHVENDREHSSTDLEEKYSDLHGIDDPSIQFAHQQMDNFSKSIESKPFPVQHYDLQQENILISDDSVETKEVIKVYSVKEEKEKKEKPISDFVSNLADSSNEDLTKPELKEAVQISAGPYNYDEIEEKLKQICDGYFEENNSNNMEKTRSVSDNQKEVLQQASSKTPVHRSINYKHSSGNNIGHMLTNDTEDIEIIFSTGEEDTRARKYASHNNDMADEVEILYPPSTVDSVGNNKKNKQNINVTPTNIMAAMKRKRRTRDEIMKSIERSISNVFSQDTNSISDSDTFDDTAEVEDQKKIRKMKTQDESDSDASPTTTRFTVKVTGHPDDVSDIMHDLSRDTGDTNLQEYNDVRSPKEDNGFVTSVITIDDCPADVNDKAECQDDDTLSPCIRDITGNDLTKVLLLPSTSRNCCCPSTTVIPHFDEENNLSKFNTSRLIPVVNVTQSPMNNRTLKYKKLQRKLSVQTNVVQKLANQLISSKRVETGLQNKNSTLEKKIQSMTNELNALSNGVPTKVKEDMGTKKLIEDLTSKLNHFEGANKNLVKTANTGIEQVKKLESQLKQRDNQIKELNWKLDKASKFLERAEKNTNTYRKKLLNLQGLLRRKKLLDEKMKKFNEILVDAVNKSYTRKKLPMSLAMRIKKTCGATEYDKLLQSGFPLPSLSAMRNASNNLSDSNEDNEDNEISQAGTSRDNVDEVRDAQCMENHMKIESENVESLDEEITETVDDTETVMGTVQDIFDESSDDDFNKTDLTEDFISQLHKFM